MKAIALWIIGILMLTATVQAAETLPAVIERAEINDIPLIPEANNALNINRGEELEILLTYNAPERLRNVEIEASMAGYEFNEMVTEELRAQKYIGTVDVNTSKSQKLKLTIPEDLDTQEWLLTVTFKDRNHAPYTQLYRLRIGAEREDINIEDVRFQPFAQATAGDAVFTRVRLENLGQGSERDVKVTVQFPELGLQDFSYVNKIEADEEEESEELYIQLPKCAEPGVYEARIVAEWNDGRSYTTRSMAYQILENPDCKEEVAPVQIIVQQPEPEATSGENVARKVLETMLIVLLVLLVIVGLIVGVSRLASN